VRWFSVVLLTVLVACDVTDDPAGFDPNYCPAVADWDDGWADFEREVADLVNERRSEGGVCGNGSFGPSGPLSMDTKLRCAARNHSRDMATRGYFDHVSPDGDDIADRLARAGFEWSAIGENIARGQESPAEVMQGWMDSPGHCANILEPRFDFIGVGYLGDGAYWTQTFGAP
jgi:uncharacterized protein YkwD